LESSERTTFIARAGAVAAAAGRLGITLRKSPRAFELIAEAAGNRITFPIVSDAQDWRETSAEEAFYVMLLDAHEWALARLDDAMIATLPSVEQDEVPAMRREEASALQRLQALATLLGGEDRLTDLFNAAGLSPVTVSA